jgi:hypothetical protein
VGPLSSAALAAPMVGDVVRRGLACMTTLGVVRAMVHARSGYHGGGRGDAWHRWHLPQWCTCLSQSNVACGVVSVVGRGGCRWQSGGGAVGEW